MDLNQIGFFIRLVELGSFTRAAAELGAAKSSVSRALMRLEEDLGVRLIERTTRKLSLTTAGRAYFDQVRGALATISDASEMVRQMGQEPRGTVRISAPPDLAIVLTPIVSRFIRCFPKIHLQLLFTMRVVDLVEEAIDLAIRVGHSKDSSLSVRLVGHQTLGLFASENYIRRNGRPGKLADLTGHDCVLFRSQGGGQDWRHTLSLWNGREAESVDISGPLEVDEILAIRQAVADGVGIGLVPLFLTAKGDRLIRILPKYKSQPLPVNVVSVSRRLEPARVAMLRDYLVESLGKFRWNG
ncbi:MAG: LysR family transcriptional regulator [Candidatus Binataceae bacterium]